MTTWDELQEGTEHTPAEYGPLSRTDLVRYQGASGDFNPIHHDEGFAQAAGFPTVFSVGMLQAGILASYSTDWLGAANVRRFSVQVASQTRAWPLRATQRRDQADAWKVQP
jgi:acyl dehydratase